MNPIKISSPAEAAKIVRAGRQTAILYKDMQTFGHIYGRAFSLRGSAFSQVYGRYYIIAKYPPYK